MTRALQKDPLARPTADQLLVDLVKTAMAGSLPPGGSIAMATVVLDRTWHQGLPNSADVGPLPHSPDRRRRWIALAAFILVAALIAGGVFALSRSDNKTLANDSTTTTHAVGVASPATTKASAATTNTTTQSPSPSPTALESATLPLVACPTSYGVDPSPTPAALPSSTTESVPADLATQVTVYTDEQGNMKLLAPTGWVCNANFGADGSGGVTITPTGETLPSGQLSQGSTVEAIVGSETSACVQCREGQACPLFATAAADYEQDYQMTCPSEKPGEESSEPIEDGVVGFLDPPGVAGDAYPSGGEYPANAVMTYHSGNENGSWLDTCTLPYSQQALCTAVLNSFANTYGSE